MRVVVENRLPGSMPARPALETILRDIARPLNKLLEAAPTSLLEVGAGAYVSMPQSIVRARVTGTGSVTLTVRYFDGTTTEVLGDVAAGDEPMWVAGTLYEAIKYDVVSGIPIVELI